MTKISDCKFDISEHSPEWHKRYNYIIDEYISLNESHNPSAISSLSEDDCISLAINLAKIDPEESPVSWSQLSSRLDTLTSIAIPDQHALTIKVFLSFLNVSSTEASILFQASQYTWADPDNLCFTVINIPHDALRTKGDITRLESVAIEVVRKRVKVAYHRHQSQLLNEQGKYLLSRLEAIKMKASKASRALTGLWL